jgi:predicted nucleic acid-binding protein
MKPLFADTFYWLALLNPGDNWHQTVLNYTHQHPDQELVTSDGVLDEMLNYASTRGIVMREKALALYAYVIRSPLITIIPYTPNLREKGLELYAKRSVFTIIDGLGRRSTLKKCADSCTDTSEKNLD